MRGGLKTGSHQTLPLFLVLHSFKHHEIPKLDRIEKKTIGICKYVGKWIVGWLD